jgi:hypothetical protein
MPELLFYLCTSIEQIGIGKKTKQASLQAINIKT